MLVIFLVLMQLRLLLIHLKLKKKKTVQTGNDDKKKKKIKELLKCLLFNCQIIFDLKWSTDAVANQGVTFSKTDTNLDVSVVTLSTQDNTKQLEQLQSGFKRTINWNRYPSKVSTERINK